MIDREIGEDHVNLFVLHHTHVFGEGEEDVKLIGIYSTEELATRAIASLTRRPGFSEHPKQFEISRYILDENNWTEGFATLP